MNLALFIGISLILGIAGSILYFRMRLKKIISELHEKISEVQRFFSSGGNTPDNAAATPAGSLDELADLSARISDLKSIRKEVVIIKNDESEKKDAELKNKLDNLMVVNELGQRITSSLNLDDVFNHLYGTLHSMMDAEVLELGVYFWKDNNWKILSNLNKDSVQA